LFFQNYSRNGGSLFRPFTKSFALGRRFYPALSEKEVDQIWDSVRKDKSNIVDYRSLPGPRQKWLRRVNTVCGMSIATAGLSSILVVPIIHNYWQPDIMTALCFGAFSIICGPETCRIVADLGLVKSVPVLLFFPLVFFGIPIVSLLQYYPVEFIKGTIIGLFTLILNGIAIFYGPQKLDPSYNGFIVNVLSPIVALSLLAVLLPPLSSLTNIGMQLALVGTCSWITHYMFRRQFKFAKWSPLIEDLDERLPHAVMLMMLGPILLLIGMVVINNCELPFWKKMKAPPIEEMKDAK